MNELLREIEDDIRRERFDRFWHGFGKIMVWVSLAVIVCTIIVVVVQNRKQAREMEQASQFIKGIERMQNEDYKSAIPIFSSLSMDPSSPYYEIAMLRKAQAETNAGDKDAAAKTYQSLATHGELGDLAKMMAVQGDNPLEPQKSSPFYYSQSEWRGWEFMQQGKKDEAVAQFLSLYQNLEAPQSIHERLGEVLNHIAPEKMASLSNVSTSNPEVPAQKEAAHE